MTVFHVGSLSFEPLVGFTNNSTNVTNAVAVMYSRNIPMAEMRIVCFQSKKVVKKFLGFFYISNNYYIYLKRYFEILVTNDFLSIFWRSAALKYAVSIFFT